MLEDSLKPALQQRRDQSRYRQHFCIETPQQTHLRIDGQSYLAFCSNDYLGLANHPEVVSAMQRAAADFGVGSGASHLVCGHSHYHRKLEEALATFTGRARALLFSSGYMANLGVISALTDRGDSIFEDRLNHASLIDAAQLSRAQFKRFHHGDCQHLQQQLETVSKGRKLVVVDGVFSMDGDLAPLPELAALCREQGAWLMVDDAHGFGVLGESGGGCAQHFALASSDLPILVGTLGKSFGTFGAFVAGSELLIESLIQFSRTYIYTTALPPAVAAASLASLQLIQNKPELRRQLQDRIQQFRSGATALGLPLMPSLTAIQPLVLGQDALVVKVAEQLRQQNILITAIRPPTVPEGTARLRITLCATHTREDIEHLLESLDRTLPAECREQ
ncbi:MAG: 8-amino-7-oxononanoate synthase [Cellvibrionaceae bacterium]|jgi:8-amino-7-oxononanoate synthase